MASKGFEIMTFGKRRLRFLDRVVLRLLLLLQTIGVSKIRNELEHKPGRGNEPVQEGAVWSEEGWGRLR